MKGMFAVVAFVALTAFSWGVYGPTLHQGQHGLGATVEGGKHVPSLLRAFTCVGLAYFGIAVVAPLALLSTRKEAGGWTASGTFWSLTAGALGALGALGIILAFKSHGSPVYVMPLVFGGAPVVNTFFTMFLNKSYREAGPLFFAGLILVVLGAVVVMLWKPATHAPGGAAVELVGLERVWVPLWIVVTALSWGMYGPVLHKGQMAMRGSRLRPFMCVGWAYFLVAVIVPLAILSRSGEPGGWNFGGTLWSLAGGAFGALGALGIILAFNSGGKPIYVMPLVFGGAPVVNTLTTLAVQGVAQAPSPIFYAGLLIVAAGAVAVLVFAPKARPHGAAPAARPAAEQAAGR